MNKGLCLGFFISVSLMGSMMSVAWADFGVRGTAYENDTCCSQGEPPLYGNGQSLRFKQSIEGGQLLTLEEKNALAAELPLIEKKLYYGRMRLNKGYFSLSRLKNQSTDFNGGLAVIYKTASASQNGLELAFGYIWEPTFWGDLEYLVNKNFKRSAAPVFVGSLETLPFTIKNSTILANVYYNFMGFSRFEPYVTAGAGVSINSARATTPLGFDISTETYSLALAGGLGMRIGFFSRWYIDCAYRFISLGTSNIKSSNDPAIFTKVSTDYTVSVVSLGLIFLF